MNVKHTPGLLLSFLASACACGAVLLAAGPAAGVPWTARELALARRGLLQPDRIMVLVEAFFRTEPLTAPAGAAGGIDDEVRPFLAEVLRRAPGTANAVTARKVLEVLDAPPPAYDRKKPVPLAALLDREQAMQDEVRRITNQGLRVVALAKHRRELRSWIGRRVEAVAAVVSVRGDRVTLEVQAGRGPVKIQADARVGAVAAGLDGGQTVRVRGRLSLALSSLLNDCEITPEK
jgi:hypothetical protein